MTMTRDDLLEGAILHTAWSVCAYSRAEACEALWRAWAEGRSVQDRIDARRLGRKMLEAGVQ